VMKEYPAYSFHQVLQRLPPHARRKWHGLIAAVDDTEALLRLSFERQKALQERRDAIAYRLSYLDRASEHEAIADAKAEIEIIESDLMKLADERAKREGVKANCDQVLSSLRAFIMTTGFDLPGADGRQMLPVAVQAKPNEGETLADAIIRVRSEIGMAKSELQRVRSAPPSRDEIEDALRREVQTLITRGTPSVNIDGGKITTFWPDRPVLGGAKNEAVAAPAGSASALIAAMFPDVVYKMLTQGLDQLEGGISADERARRTAEIERQVLLLEHEEESLVTQALAAGLEVHRRPSASGWALLAIAPPPAAADQMMVAAE
jgi:hypothetical protein